MQTFAPSIFQFCNANIQGEVKYNVGFAICIQKTCMHFAQSSWNLTLGQQACLNVALNTSGAYQKKVNESEDFYKMSQLAYKQDLKKKKKKEKRWVKGFQNHLVEHIHVILLIWILNQITNSRMGVTTMH